MGTHIAVIYSCVFKTHQILSSLAPLIIRRVGFHNHSLWVQESALSFILEMWVMINIEPFVCTMYIVQSKYIKGIGKAIPTNFHSAEHCSDDSSQCNMLSSDEPSCYYHLIWCIMIYHQHACYIQSSTKKKRVWLRFETQRQGALLLILMNNNEDRWVKKIHDKVWCKFKFQYFVWSIKQINRELHWSCKTKW